MDEFNKCAIEKTQLFDVLKRHFLTTP